MQRQLWLFYVIYLTSIYLVNMAKVSKKQDIYIDVLRLKINYCSTYFIILVLAISFLIQTSNKNHLEQQLQLLILCKNNSQAKLQTLKQRFNQTIVVLQKQHQNVRQYHQNLIISQQKLKQQQKRSSNYAQELKNIKESLKECEASLVNQAFTSQNYKSQLQRQLNVIKELKLNITNLQSTKKAKKQQFQICQSKQKQAREKWNVFQSRFKESKQLFLKKQQKLRICYDSQLRLTQIVKNYENLISKTRIEVQAGKKSIQKTKDQCSREKASINNQKIVELKQIQQREKQTYAVLEREYQKCFIPIRKQLKEQQQKCELQKFEQRTKNKESMQRFVLSHFAQLFHYDKYIPIFMKYSNEFKFKIEGNHGQLTKHFQFKESNIIQKNSNQVIMLSSFAIPATQIHFIKLKIIKIYEGMIGFGVLLDKVNTEFCWSCYNKKKIYFNCQNGYIYNGQILGLIQISKQSKVGAVKNGDTIAMFIDSDSKKIVWYVNDRYTGFQDLHEEGQPVKPVYPFIVMTQRGDQIQILTG